MKIGNLYRVSSGAPKFDKAEDGASPEYNYVYVFPLTDTPGRYLEIDEVFMIVDEHKMVGRKDLHDVALIGEEVLLLSTGWDRAAVKVETRS